MGVVEYLPAPGGASPSDAGVFGGGILFFFFVRSVWNPSPFVARWYRGFGERWSGYRCKRLP